MCIYQRIYCLKVRQGGNVMGGQNTFDTLTNIGINKSTLVGKYIFLPRRYHQPNTSLFYSQGTWKP